MSLGVHCKKCCSGGTGYVLGQPCITPGCDGIVEEIPPFGSLVDELPELMTCGRRFDTYPGGIPAHHDRGQELDRWQKFKSNGDRVCSYCGSLHPDDFFAAVKAAADAPEGSGYREVVAIEPSDKIYKIYVSKPGVRNAMEGGIKFYTQHLPRDEQGKLLITEEQENEYRRAVKATGVRFDAYLRSMDARRSA